MSVSYVFLDAEFKIFPELLYHPHLLLKIKKGWNLLRQDTKVCFTVGAMKTQGFLLPGRRCPALKLCLFRSGCSWPCI